MRHILISTAAMFAFASAAQADNLAAGALFGSPTQSKAVCYIFNASKNDIVISSFRIMTQAGSAGVLTANECGTFPATLAGERSCGIAINANNQVFSCKAVVNNKTNARGVFEMRNSSGVTLANVPLE